ncbi:MAG: hypothetical protein ACXVXI_05780 [Mycobacteriaceae bacterium]
MSIQVHPLLAKGASSWELLVWLGDGGTAGGVMCTHGEVFDALLVAARDITLVTLGPATVIAKGAARRVTCRERRSAELGYPLPDPCR